MLRRSRPDDWHVALVASSIIDRLLRYFRTAAMQHLTSSSLTNHLECKRNLATDTPDTFASWAEEEIEKNQRVAKRQRLDGDSSCPSTGNTSLSSPNETSVFRSVIAQSDRPFVSEYQRQCIPVCLTGKSPAGATSSDGLSVCIVVVLIHCNRIRFKMSAANRRFERCPSSCKLGGANVIN